MTLRTTQAMGTTLMVLDQKMARVYPRTTQERTPSRVTARATQTQDPSQKRTRPRTTTKALAAPTNSTPLAPPSWPSLVPWPSSSLSHSPQELIFNVPHVPFAICMGASPWLRAIDCCKMRGFRRWDFEIVNNWSTGQKGFRVIGAVHHQQYGVSFFFANNYTSICICRKVSSLRKTPFRSSRNSS